jgi:hypothetical protein
LRGLPGKEFKSAKFQVEYDCKSDLYRGLYYGTFSDHMGRGALTDGGPIKVGDPLVDWQAMPPDMERERGIACASAQPTITPATPLAASGRVERSQLGVRIQEVTPEIAESLGLPTTKGALVASLTPSGSAEMAGIKQGDVIEAYDGRDIITMRDLVLAVAETRVGQRVSVRLWRDGRELTLAPTIMSMSNNPEPISGDTPTALAPVRTPTPAAPAGAAVATGQGPAPSAPASRLGPPAAERDFVALIERYAAAYKAASNDMARGALRPQRAAAICSLQLGRVSGWLGKVSTLSSNNEGKGVLAVQIADDITVGTTNNAFSDGVASISTLIPVGTAVQAAAMALKEGELVRFSGRFGNNPSDCLEEISITVRGAMTDPEFLFQFSAVSPAE